jgi:hypothetical protein
VAQNAPRESTKGLVSAFIPLAMFCVFSSRHPFIFGALSSMEYLLRKQLLIYIGIACMDANHIIQRRCHSPVMKTAIHPTHFRNPPRACRKL